MSSTSLTGSVRAPRSARCACWTGWELSRSKYYQWKDRYGQANEHYALIPRDHWLEQWEKDAIIDFHHQFPLEGYRRLTFMMFDRDLVAVSPSSSYPRPQERWPARLLEAEALAQRQRF
jgi:hypothetical protein